MQHLGCCSTFVKLKILAYIAARDFLRFSQVTQHPVCLDKSISKHGKPLDIFLMMHKFSLYVLKINFPHSFSLSNTSHLKKIESYLYASVNQNARCVKLVYKKLHYEIQILHLANINVINIFKKPQNKKVTSYK